jgi:hypothetical protein
MDLPLWERKCSEGIMRGFCNHFAVTADKGPCGVDGLTGLSLGVCAYISNMDLPLWVPKCSEGLLRGNCNHLAVTADKVPCVGEGLNGLSLCVCVYVYISNMD